MRKAIVILALLGLATGVASAAPSGTLTLTYYDDFTFEVRASVSTGDNGGLAVYKIPLTGWTTVQTVKARPSSSCHPS